MKKLLLIVFSLFLSNTILSQYHNFTSDPEEYFKDGKVYKLTSSQTDKIYIGSTFQSLKDRNRVHRCRKSNNTVSYLISDYDDFKIVLLEKLHFATKKQLEEVEAAEKAKTEKENS